MLLTTDTIQAVQFINHEYTQFVQKVASLDSSRLDGYIANQQALESFTEQLINYNECDVMLVEALFSVIQWANEITMLHKRAKDERYIKYINANKYLNKLVDRMITMRMSA